MKDDCNCAANNYCLRCNWNCNWVCQKGSNCNNCNQLLTIRNYHNTGIFLYNYIQFT